MARIELDGVGIEYDLLGPAGAQAIAITPGGRMSKGSTGRCQSNANRSLIRGSHSRACIYQAARICHSANAAERRCL
jgi:hypothetical protein